MKKQYLEIEHIETIKNTVTLIYKGEFKSDSIKQDKNLLSCIFDFKRCLIEVLIFNNGIVKYNLETQNKALYTITHKKLIEELNKIYRE